jgi:hypothetical protein
VDLFFAAPVDYALQVVHVHLYGTVVVCKMGEAHAEYKSVTERVLIWKLTSKMGPAELVGNLQAHPVLQGWSVKLLPPQPLICIATVNNIVSLVRQLRSMGRDYQDHLFCLAPLGVAQLEKEYDRRKQNRVKAPRSRHRPALSAHSPQHFFTLSAGDPPGSIRPTAL